MKGATPADPLGPLAGAQNPGDHRGIGFVEEEEEGGKEEAAGLVLETSIDIFRKIREDDVITRLETRCGTEIGRFLKSWVEVDSVCYPRFSGQHGVILL